MVFLALAAIGAATVVGQRWALLEVSRVRWALAGMVVTALVSAAVLSLALRMEVVQYVFGSTALWDAFVGLVTLLLLGGAAHMIAATWFDRLPRFGRRDARRAVRRIVPVFFGCLILAGVAATLAPQANQAVGDGVTSDPTIGVKLIVSMLVMLMGVNASGFSRMLSARGLNRVASALILLMPTLGGLIAGFLLLRWAVVLSDSEMGRAQILLGLGTTEKASPGAMLLHWCGLYLFTIGAVGAGGALAMRLGPKPTGSLLAVSELTPVELQLARREQSRAAAHARRQRVRVGEFVGDVLLPVEGGEATERPSDQATEEEEKGQGPRAEGRVESPTFSRAAQRSGSEEGEEATERPSDQATEEEGKSQGPGAAGQADALARSPLAYRTDVAPAVPRRSYKRHERSTRHLFPTRGQYLLFALVYAGLCFYASLVPVNYQPLSWEQAWMSFVSAQHFGINMDRRADLLANFVLFVPLGFMLMAGFDADRHRRRVGLAALPLIVVAAALFIGAMEFTQTMFPPRTVSQNDMLAELFGTGIGILVWFGIGQSITLALRDIAARWGSALARQRLLQAYIAALVVYTLLPLDLTLSLKEIWIKWQHGRMHLMPFTSYNDWGMMLAVFARDVFVFIPVGVLLRLGWEATPRVRTVGRATLMTLAFAAALEVAKIFVFTNHSDTTKIISHTLGGLIGAAAVGHWVDEQGTVAIGRGLRSYQRSLVALMLTGVIACIAFALLLEPYHLVPSGAEFREQLDLFFGWPFAGYYWTGEWTALTQLVQFALLFVPLGMVLAWGMNRRKPWSWARQLVMVLLIAGLIGAAAEIGQAAVVGYVPYDAMYASAAGTPLFEPLGSPASLIASPRDRILQYGPLPDLTDLAAYIAGAIIGWLMARMFLAPRTGETLSRVRA